MAVFFSVINWLWQGLITLVDDWVGGLFDPLKWVNAAASVLASVLDAFASYLPGDLATQLQSVSTFLHGGRMSNLFKVAFYLIDPVCDVELMTACFAAAFTVYSLCLLLKVGTWIASMVWSSPS